MSTTRILIVEDEESLAAGIRENLEIEGYSCEMAADGPTGLALLRSQAWDLVLLDVMLPGMDGFTICETIRKEGLQFPVLFLTAKSDQDDRIRGLEVGGDDYLAKPFALRELLLRVAAILRRSARFAPERDPNSTLEFAGNRINFATFQATAWDGTACELTHKEALILKCLVKRAGEVVSREDILEDAWGYEIYPSTRTIDNFIVRLRKRFEREPDEPRHFHTQRGVGYRFTIEEDPR